MSKLYSSARTTFKVPTGKSDTTIRIHIAAPDIKAENLPLSTWTASVVLAKQLNNFEFLHTEPNSLSFDRSAIPVLELGAGTGLVGISAACLWKTTAVLTDLAPIVPGLETNIALNQETIERSGALASCGALDWSRPSSLVLANGKGIDTTQVVLSSRKARVILAADTIYDPYHPELLTSAIFEWLERGADARVCICYPLRVAYLDEIRELWQRLGDGGLESVQEGKEMHIGDSPNGDDEALCEWSVWRWKEPGSARSSSLPNDMMLPPTSPTLSRNSLPQLALEVGL